MVSKELVLRRCHKSSSEKRSCSRVGVVSVIGWLRLVGCLNLQVSFAKEPYKRDCILQKTPIISRSLLIVATPCGV